MCKQDHSAVNDSFQGVAVFDNLGKVPLTLQTAGKESNYLLTQKRRLYEAVNLTPGEDY